MATQQPANSMDAIASLLQLFGGKKTNVRETTQGGTSTQTDSTNLDQEGMAALLKQALESNQGLAAVSQGQKGAGLYNSTTNRLMTNDLLSRMTAQAALAGASKTSTKTTQPGTLTKQVTEGGMGTQQGPLSQAMLAMTAYNKLGGTKAVKDAYSSLSEMIGGIDMGAGAGDAGISAAYQGFENLSNAAPATSMGLDVASGDPGLMGSLGNMFTGGQDSASFVDFANSFSSGTQAADAAPVVEETAGNFLPASGTTSLSGGIANSNPSSSEVLSGANTPSADTTSISNADAVSVGGSVAGSLGSESASYGMSYGAGSAAANLGVTSTGTEFGSQMSVAGNAGDTAGASSAGGNILGYIGPIMSAVNAQNNPRGEQGKDYRHAVGSAVLNYFGFGWASPIVGQVATPLLNAVTDAGVESGGIAGAIVADPVGTLISGEFNTGDVMTAALDPGNIFGGNPGGSVGSVAAYGVDPIGAALGDKGVFSVVADSVNTIDSAIFGGGGGGGRVVCTELTLAGHIPVEKYQEVIKPEITLKGRILLGYHVLGVPAVRKLRADPKFVKRALPYVNAYLDHKLGKKNWRGFLIKWIGEPLCWCLSFFNTDPDYYKVLYPYRRNR